MQAMGQQLMNPPQYNQPMQMPRQTHCQVMPVGGYTRVHCF